MGGRGRLSAGAPRLLGRHDGARGRAYGRAWRALVGEFGTPVRGSLLADEMGRAAVLRVELGEAVEALDAYRRLRRPGPRKLRLLERDMRDADRVYSDALAALRLAVKNGPEPEGVLPTGETPTQYLARKEREALEASRSSQTPQEEPSHGRP